MNEVTSIAPGRVVAGPGAILADIDRATRAHSGQELRLHPSTYNTASIGGFIAGGSGGVGSINLGGLRDFGNVLRLRVVTMEAEPRVLDLTGEDLHKVTHAYGTNGIITEVEMPLTAAYDWVDVIVGFDDFMAAARFGNALACQDGILTKLITPIAAPVPCDYFKRHQKFLREGQSICVRHGRAACARRVPRLHAPRRRRGRLQRRHRDARKTRRACRRPTNSPGTTRRCGRCASIPAITYLQSLYPFPDQLALVEKMDEMFPRRGDLASRIRPLRRQHHLLRPAAGALHHGGAARRDHPPPSRTMAARSSIRTATRWRRAA